MFLFNWRYRRIYLNYVSTFHCAIGLLLFKENCAWTLDGVQVLVWPMDGACVWQRSFFLKMELVTPKQKRKNQLYISTPSYSHVPKYVKLQ